MFLNDPACRILSQSEEDGKFAMSRREDLAHVTFFFLGDGRTTWRGREQNPPQGAKPIGEARIFCPNDGLGRHPLGIFFDGPIEGLDFLMINWKDPDIFEPHSVRFIENPTQIKFVKPENPIVPSEFRDHRGDSRPERTAKKDIREWAGKYPDRYIAVSVYNECLGIANIANSPIYNVKRFSYWFRTEQQTLKKGADVREFVYECVRRSFNAGQLVQHTSNNGEKLVRDIEDETIKQITDKLIAHGFKLRPGYWIQK